MENSAAVYTGVTSLSITTFSIKGFYVTLGTCGTQHNNTAIMLSVVMLNVVVLSFVMLNVVMLSFVMLSVVASFIHIYIYKSKTLLINFLSLCS